MTIKIVYTSKDPEFLEETDEFEVLDVFDLQDRYAVKVRDVRPAAEERFAELASDDDRVIAVEDDFDARLLTAPTGEGHISAERVVTMEEIREFHAVDDDDETGAGRTVVVMDSGIDPTHEVFTSVPEFRLVDCTGSGYGDTNGHGTAVAGQIHRLAPDSELVALRIFGNEGTTSSSVILRAYEWLLQHADEFDVVNMSWGTTTRSRQLDAVHTNLLENDVRDVVAAGNSGGPGGSPATAQGAFSVGACTISGTLASYSSYNPEFGNPDVCAVGSDCRLARARGTNMGDPLDGKWTKASGTSFSAPVVAGLVARYWERFPEHDIERIADDFEAGARDIPETPEDGNGIVDYSSTLASGSE